MEVATRKRTFFRSFFLMMMSLLFSASVWGQEATVRGTVKDAAGEPVIGANVRVRGTSKGSISDYNGNYQISEVNIQQDVIEFSFIGYKAIGVVCNGKTQIDVILREDTEFLDEVVVVGYGSLSKKELSSSIVQVDRKDFMQGAMSNPMELLTGKVAGLNVNTTAAANPNAGSSLQIRGATSISASNDPLIVIDGVAGGNIRNLSSQDIESMTVLKDAASAAIYGTRGANGVILITTKKGASEEGKTQVTYDSWFGVNFVHGAPDILSADEFRRSRRGTDYGYSTDWYNLLTRSFSYDNNQYLSIHGNARNGSYGLSLNYKKATGIDIKSEREEYGGRFVTEQRILDNRLQINGSLSARRVNEVWGNDGMFDTALSMNPTMPLYNEDGTYYQPTSPTDARNPVAELKDIDNNGQRLYVLGSAEAKLNILRGEKHTLNTSLSYSLHYDDLKQHYYTPSTSGESYWSGYDGRAEVTYQKWNTHRLEWLANYALDIKDHSLKVVAGYTYEESNWERLMANNSDFAFDNTKWHDIGSGSFLTAGKAGMGTGQSLSKLIGVFGRINYNWRNLWMVSASIRHEGSTKFGKDHKWGSFPSLSLAWEIANMKFMESASHIVQSLKPRISYGVTGRSDFNAYQSLATYSTNGSYFIDGEWVKGYAPSANANSELGWEKSVSTNIGVDFVLWNRLRGSIDLFDRRSKDLLYNYTAPQPPFVYSSILVNVGTTQNRGIEIALDGDVFKNTPVKWSTGINYAYGTTKLKKLSNDIYQASYLELYLKPGVGTSEYFFRVQEDGKIGQFYGYKYAGMENGNMLIYDNDGNKIPVSEADASYKRYIGNGTPTSFLSWNNTLRYRNFDLNIFFRGAFSFDIFNMRTYGMGLKGAGTDNVLRDAYLKYDGISTGGGVISSFFLEKGDYFKLENVTLGYNFTPNPNKYVDNLRVFISAKNLFTLTDYSGNDPSIVSVNGIEPGIDTTSAYPTATQLSLGVTLRFK
jgi:TonB-linked SusC/RagA family outer membrane protein